MKYAKEIFLSFILFSFLMFSSVVSGKEAETEARKILPKEKQGNVELVTLPKWVSCTKQGIKLLDLISGQYGEPIIASGDGDETPVGDQTNGRTQLILLWNSETKSYTISELFPDGGACILLVGENLTFLGKFKPDTKGKKIEPKLEDSEEDLLSKKIYINYDSSIPVNKPVH